MSESGLPSLLSAVSPDDMGGKNAVVTAIDEILPQTQCTQCGYSGCKPYARAIARGEAEINQCPPGGETGIRKLAELLHQPYKPLNPAHGIHKPRALAAIDENLCIGCTLCIQACPVDAILGAAKQMHTVIQQECTGCELCVTPCPVDCIRMVPHSEPVMDKPSQQRARARHEFRRYRLEREKQERAERHARRAAAAGAQAPDDPAVLAKKAAIAAAMARVRAQQAQAQPRNIENLSANTTAEIAAIEARRARVQQQAGNVAGIPAEQPMPVTRSVPKTQPQ